VQISRSIGSATDAISRQARWLCSALVALAVLLGGLATADAGRNVVVRDFEGPRAKKIRADVVKTLKSSGHQLVAKGKFERARKRLGGGDDEDSLSKAAAAVNADAVVEGSVRKRKKKVRLRLVLRSGTTGEVVDTVTIQLGRRPVLKPAKRRVIARKFSGLIDDLPGVVVDEIEDEPVVDDEPDDEVAPVAQADTGEDPLGGDADVSAEAERSPLSDSERYNALTRNRAIDIAIGLSATGRSLSFALTPEAETAGVTTPNEYSGSVVPGAVISGEVYPAMLFADRRDPGVLANIGISFLYDQVLLINSQLEDAEGDAADIDTTQNRLRAGLVYRLNFGDSPTSPQLKLGGGYGLQEFSLDVEAAGIERCMDAGVNASPAGCIDLPNVDYTYFDALVGARFGIVPKLALLVEGRVLFITDAGGVEAEGSYGDASSLGFDVDLGVEYRVMESVVVRASGRYQRFSLDFTESNPITDRDGDNMFDVDSAVDSYFGIVVSAGYLY